MTLLGSHEVNKCPDPCSEEICDHVLGIEGSVWTKHCTISEMKANVKLNMIRYARGVDVNIGILILFEMSSIHAGTRKEAKWIK